MHTQTACTYRWYEGFYAFNSYLYMELILRHLHGFVKNVTTGLDHLH